MAFSYQPQHLAWKERVETELACSVRSPREPPGRKGLPPLWTGRSYQSEDSIGRVRVKGLKDREVNLGYTFGGYTSARYAFKDLDQSKKAGFPQRRYEEELRKLIAEEQRRQAELRAKLASLHTSKLS